MSPQASETAHLRAAPADSYPQIPSFCKTSQLQQPG